MTTFEIITLIAAPPARLFDLSLDVDVHTESMAGSGEEATGGITAGRLKKGETVTWRARHFGIYWYMTARITDYEPPRYFADEQVSGPFKRWHHTHYFEPDGHGGTVMRDLVEFVSRGGALGALADALMLRRYMHRLICRRNDHLKMIAENSNGSAPGRA